MITRLLWRALCRMTLLCTVSHLASSTDNKPDSSAPEQGVTFSHIYKIDIPGSSGCMFERLPAQDEAGLQTDTTKNGENDIIFKHNIRLQTPKCDCDESENFKSLLYRVNGLEEEVNYLKSQCSQGCCGRGGAGGVDTSCSGHGTYDQNTCSCICNQGWEGPDCSVSSCPDECNDNGRCVDGKCVCHEGYTGEDCSQLACPNDCNDKGQCVDGKCVCFPHFTGEDCSTPTCPNDCVGNGRCVDGQCICDEGFYGEDCSLVLGPQGLRLVKVTDVSLLVEWESVRGAEYYVLTYHPKYDESAMEEIQIPNTENSYLITGLTPGVTYIVKVYAVIKKIRSDDDTIEATTDVSTIDDVQVLGQTEVSIEVDWKNPQAEVDYFRLIHTDPSGQEEETDVQSSQEARTKHTIVGLYPGTEYQISVQAIKGNTEGNPSYTTGVTDIDAPRKLVTVEVTEDTASLSWDKVQAEIEGYMLSYTSAEGSSPDIPVGRDRTAYKLVGLRPGVIYTVYIWAFKGDKVSRKTSAEAETDIDSPRDLRAFDVTVDSASLAWSPPLADIEGYILTYRSEDGVIETVEKQLGAGETRFALSNLEMGKRYVVTIIAYRGNKRSKVTETIFKTVGLMYPFPMDCVQIMKNGNTKSGIYTVYINNDRSKPIEVYCDMDTDGGGWLMLQRRNTGKLDFMKRWRQYMAGFGNMTDEFFIGLDKIYELTNTPTQYELRFDLGLGSDRAYAVYDNFKIGPVKQKFKLTVGKYRGTAGDAMTYHQGRPWTTVDSDNDISLGNCALTHRGAWWYKNCHLANLNGNWGDNRHSMGVNWEPWKGHLTSLDFTEMKIRPVGAMSSRKKRSLVAREKSRTSNTHKK
ncbi:tenascin-N isoform X4 [Melanotaenia boesemani]|uniref:tenascin-N isoform X4 n=1 Tax=Melanotaenia boesemani TaxID=1250792 RepID=UPI001C05947E|nr:tenascin-N isoform X4 [Melanotaenia boesemani]